MKLSHESRSRQKTHFKDEVVHTADSKPSYKKLSKSNSGRKSCKKRKINKTIENYPEIEKSSQFMLKHCENQITSDFDNVLSKMPHKPKHRRNRSIYASSKQDSFEKEHEELNQLVIQTIKKSQAQPTQSKIQYVDDFTEDINTLAEKVENEHKKESQRKQFSISQDIKSKHLGSFLKGYDANKLKMEEIQEEAVEELNHK